MQALKNEFTANFVAGVSLVGSSVLTAAPPRPTLVLASVEVPYRWWCAEP
jgi:hypothetical protein